jgi:hypothetical protein
MKNIKTFSVLFLALIGSSVGHAQMEGWEGVDMGRIGYKQSNFNLNMTSFDHNVRVTNSSSQFSDEIGPNESLGLGSLDLSFEAMGNHAYFFLDGSMIPNLIQGLVMKERLKEKLTFKSGNELDYVEFLPMRVAFGGTIAKYFGLYVGGQYMYSTINTKDNDQFVTIGGNQRGAGAHAFFAKGPFLARYSYMYDWIRREKRTFKGIAITHEVSLAFNFGESGVGLIARAGIRTRKMDANYGEYDEATRSFGFMPSFQSVDKYLTFGIFAGGLFSGVTYTTVKVAKAY